MGDFMKKFFAILLVVVMILPTTAMIAFSAGGETISSFSISSVITTDDKAPTVEWFLAEDGNYYLFVPTSISTKLCKVNFGATGEVKIDGVPVSNGSVISLSDKSSISVSCNGKTYVVYIIAETKLASVFVTTQSGSLDTIHANKDHKEAGYIQIVGDDGLTYEYDGALEYIKGRGNSTWKMDKKPYNLKLDKKADLFGMGKSKKWSLIANHGDTSLMRNAIIYSVAGKVLDYTPKYTPVDLYINNDYMGSYILTTRVEVDDNRVEIDNLDDANEDANPGVDIESLSLAGTRGTYSGLMSGTQKWVEIPNNPDDISGGYLIEMEISDRYDAEISGFVSKNGQPFVFKNPEYASEKQVKYISGVYQNFEDAVMSEDGYNSNGDYYTELCDVETFQKFYAINEWASNMDCGLTSTYLYKPQGDDKLYAGPVWDFDIALGNNSSDRYGCNYMNPKEFTVCFGRQYKNTIFGQADIKKVPTLFNALCQKEDFVKGVKKVWDKEIVSVINKMNTTEIDKYAKKIEGSAVANAIRWNIYGTSDIDTIKSKFNNDVKFVKDFSTKRAKFLTDNFGKVQVQVNTNSFENVLNAVLGGLASMDILGAITGVLGGVLGGLGGGEETPDTPQQTPDNTPDEKPTVNDDTTNSPSTNSNSTSNSTTNGQSVAVSGAGSSLWVFIFVIAVVTVGVLILVL